VFAAGDWVEVGRGHPDSYYHVFVSDDGGASFTMVHADTWNETSGQFKRPYGLWAVSANELYIVGGAGPNLNGGYLAHSVDGGHSFTQSDYAKPLRAIWGAGSEVWAVGDGGVVLHAVDGTSFAVEMVPSSADFHAIAGDANDLYVVGSGGAILHRRR
jgi:hypothetical protein